MLKTLHLHATDPADLARAAAILRDDGLVAFPTETVYGLGANAFSAAAVQKIFVAKARPSWDPLIVHTSSALELHTFTDVEPGQQARVLALGDAFWPGPLTLLLPRLTVVPDAVTAGRPLVGVRIPAHPAAQALLRLTALPLAAPSANRFGHTSPTTAQHVLDDLEGRIDAVLDGGPCMVGVESTVLDPQPTPMVIFRAGAVTPEQIRHVTGCPVEFHETGSEAASPHDQLSSLPSPGVGLRHYAPDVPVLLTAGEPDALWAAVKEALVTERQVGVLLPVDWHLRVQEARLAVQPWGAWNEPASLATELFAGLRALERSGARVILCPLPPAGGLGEALRDRLRKAAKLR